MEMEEEGDEIINLNEGDPNISIESRLAAHHIPIPADVIGQRHLSVEDFEKSEDQKYVRRIKHFDSTRQLVSGSSISGSENPIHFTPNKDLDEIPESTDPDHAAIEVMKAREAAAIASRRKSSQATSSGKRSSSGRTGRRSSLEDFNGSDDQQFVNRLRKHNSFAAAGAGHQKFHQDPKATKNPMEEVEEESGSLKKTNTMMGSHGFISKINKLESRSPQTSRNQKSDERFRNVPSGDQQFVKKITRFNSIGQFVKKPPVRQDLTSELKSFHPAPHDVYEIVEDEGEYYLDPEPIQENFNNFQRPIPQYDFVAMSPDQQFVSKLKRFDSTKGIPQPSYLASSQRPQGAHYGNYSGRKLSAIVEAMNNNDPALYQYPSDFQGINIRQAQGFQYPESRSSSSQFVDRIKRYNSISKKQVPSGGFKTAQQLPPLRGQVAHSDDQFYQHQDIHDLPSMYEDQRFVNRITRFNSMTRAPVNHQASAYIPQGHSIVEQIPEEYEEYVEYPSATQPYSYGEDVPMTYDQYPNHYTNHLRSVPVMTSNNDYVGKIMRFDSITRKPVQPKSYEAQVQRNRKLSEITEEPNNPQYNESLQNNVRTVYGVPQQERQPSSFMDRIKRYNSITRVPAAIPNRSAFNPTPHGSYNNTFSDQANQFNFIPGNGQSSFQTQSYPMSSFPQENSRDTRGFVEKIKRFDSTKGRIVMPSNPNLNPNQAFASHLEEVSEEFPQEIKSRERYPTLDEWKSRVGDFAHEGRAAGVMDGVSMLDISTQREQYVPDLSGRISEEDECIRSARHSSVGGVSILSDGSHATHGSRVYDNHLEVVPDRLSYSAKLSMYQALLQTIRGLSLEGKLSVSQRKCLKVKTISKDPFILQLASSYEMDGDRTAFEASLIKLASQ